MRIKTAFKLNNSKNHGFTLVEMIVILVLFMILITLGIGGLFAWQDWTRFKQENTAAETIFYAAQSQLGELSLNGMMEDKVMTVLKSDALSGNLCGTSANPNYFNGSRIAYDAVNGDKKFYTWDTSESAIWRNAPLEENLTPDDSIQNYQGSIYYLSASRGDYGDYLNGSLMNVAGKEDAVLLFDLIAPYISDKSVLNGAILMEFSPEAGQVFSVCYSDRVESFDYVESNTAAKTSVFDRTESVRRDLMMGYYATDSLSMPLIGRSKGAASNITLYNEETLNLKIDVESGVPTSTKYNIVLYKGSEPETGNELLSFVLSRDQVNEAIKDVEAAGKKPIFADVTFYSGTFRGKTIEKMPFPVWYVQGVINDENEVVNEIHIAFDAADAQAQSYLLEEHTAGNIADNTFFNTYSFYRFGFNLSSFKSVCCGVSVDTGIGVGEEAKSNAEHPTFASCEKIGSDRVYSIKNGRHLYNVRFETDYKKNTTARIFKLIADIDWNEFRNYSKDVTKYNYFLNSYAQNANISTGEIFKAGICYNGSDHSINRNTGEITAANQYDTLTYAFPGFRKLSEGDVFTARKSEDSDETYTISNLEIAFSSNVRYGVYGKAYADLWTSEFIPLYGTYTQNSGGGAAHKSANKVHEEAMKGNCPLGLFAENHGEITYVTLNEHKVVGMEELNYGSDSPALVYTNMVGGFVGNNLGKVSYLKLRDVADLGDSDTIENEVHKTHINGKTDVGGIIGRQSWVNKHYSEKAYEGSELTRVTLDHLENYGRVTGMENVGGIVGKAFVIREKPTNGNTNAFNKRISYYNDGYQLFGAAYQANGSFDDELKTFTDTEVKRVDSIAITNCKNRGNVSGDSIIYRSSYTIEAYSAKNEKLTNSRRRCSFIGGIAGITMDGLFSDTNDFSAYSESLKSDPRMLVENCNSYRLYSDSDINSIKSAASNTSFPAGEIRNKIEHDYFVGGLIGYARITTIKDCNNNAGNNSTKAFVFGRNYVGGLFGCFDMSFVNATDLIENRYNIVNNVNTIGIMYVGGFAGGTGIGDADKEKFYVAFPSANEGSQPSGIKDMEDANKHIDGVKNEAVVLGVRRELLDYSTNGIVYLQDTDISTGIKKDHIVRNYPDSCVGGVVGCTNMYTANFDSKQSAGTKALALSLIGINKAYDEVTYNDVAATWDKSLYGGNGVGGVYGKTMYYGNVNKQAQGLAEAKHEHSICDAVVYGENAVGGLIGGSGRQTDVKKTIKSSRLYSQNSLVMGKNMVGGIIGYCMQEIYYTYTNIFPDCGNYRVYGKYAVGGFAGVSGIRTSDADGNNVSSDIDAYINKPVEVQGKAYVGGFMGVYYQKNKSTEISVEQIKVKAEYFAGGFAGAIYSNYVSGSCQNVSTANIGKKTSSELTITSKFENINVTATRAFAGGFTGLYAYHKGLGSSTPVADDLSERSTEIQSRFASLTGDNRASGYLVQLMSSIENSSDLIAALESQESSAEGALNPNYGGTAVETPELTFNDNMLGSSVTVEAPVFAGGMFGYVPSNLGMRVNLNNKDVKAEVTATGSIYAENTFAHDYKTAEEDTFAADNKMKLSYAGGIMGRVPYGLTVSNASYIGKLTASGSYLGQIAEVNDGIITECTVKEFNSEDSKNTYTGGLTGLNSINGIVKADNKFANGISLRGSAVLGAYMGRNLADIELVSAAAEKPWGAWTGITGAGINSMSIDKTADSNVVSGSAIGLLAGENAGTIDVKGSSMSCTIINDADFAGLYAGINNGTIFDSGIKVIIDELEANSSQGRYADIPSTQAIDAKLSVNNVNTTGLVAGKNIGDVNNIVTSRDSAKSSIASNGGYVGGFIGQNGDGAREGKIEKCINYMNVNATGSVSYAAGIAALAGGKSNITLCDNRASISAKTSASGILGWSSDGVTSENSNTIEECVNMGTITAEADNSTAGIAGKVNYGSVELCRNYGSAAYGMSASADNEVTFYANLEASGNNEGVDNSDAEDAQLTLNPIAPIDDRSALERNYYIYGSYSGELTNIGEGYYTQKYVGPGSEGHTFKNIDFTQNEAYDENASDYFTGQNIISDASGLDVMEAFKSWYLRGYNAQGFIQSIRPENGNYIRSLYNKMAGQNYNGGDLNQDFQNLLYGVFAIYYNHVGNNDDTWGVHYTTVLGVRVVSRVVANYDGLIDLIREIVGPVENIGNPDNHDNNIIPARFGTTVYKDGYTVGVDENTVTDVLQDTTSHWPKQLYYHTDDAGAGSLVYHRWNSYYATPIGGLDNSVMSSADNMFSQIDKQFVDMVKNEDEYPNYDVYSDGNLVKQGFLPGESTP